MEQIPTSRIDRKKEDTQNKIIMVSVELFNQLGLETVTMEQIAETADIAKGTLYNYFSSKEAIINAYLQRTFQDRNEDHIAKLRLLPDTRSRLTHVFSVLIEGVQRQKQIFEAFMVYRMKRVLSFHPVEEGEQTGLTLLIHEIIRLGQQNHELRTDLPETLLEGLFEFALIEAIKPFYLQPEGFDQEQSIKQSVDIFLSGAKV
jgi:AcrR family transcriptional regulator